MSASVRARRTGRCTRRLTPPVTRWASAERRSTSTASSSGSAPQSRQRTRSLRCTADERGRQDVLRCLADMDQLHVRQEVLQRRWRGGHRVAEVTWNRWHVEAAKVYLTEAYVRDGDGNVVPYAGNDDGYGYYAGVAWNKEGIQNVSAAARLAKTQSYFAGTRNFADNTFGTTATSASANSICRLSRVRHRREARRRHQGRLRHVPQRLDLPEVDGTNDGKMVIATSLSPSTTRS